MNPLHQPRPKAGDCRYIARFRIANQNCTYVGSFSTYKVHLTDEILWLSDELCIPIKCISSYEMKQKGRFPPRRALEIIYRNPISNEWESVYLCDIDFIGFYHDKALLYLKTQLDEAVATIVETNIQKPIDEPIESIAPPTACEACGNPVAFYVKYQFSIGALHFFYRSEEKRFLHCKRHILIHGVPSYLITLVGGWPGLHIMFYPYIIYKQAINLKPVVGRAAYVFAFAPVIAAAALIAHFFGAF